MNDYLHFLDERASVRQFDPNTILSNDLIKEMLKHASYAPSSNNFQPWRVVVVKNKEKQRELKRLSAYQPQVETASAVFLLFGDKESYNLERWQAFHLKEGVITEDNAVEGLRLDVGLFAMNLMQVVRAFGYDSVPMRGVDFEAIKIYLKVPNDWEPILMLPVGKALQAGYPHVRKSVEEFAEIIE